MFSRLMNSQILLRSYNLKTPDKQKKKKRKRKANLNQKILVNFFPIHQFCIRKVLNTPIENSVQSITGCLKENQYHFVI